MNFLIDADLPRRTAPLIRSLGHDAEDVRDIGLGSAPDEQIAHYAQQHELCLMTGDLGFADIRNYPPDQYEGLVVFRFPDNATAKVILQLVESFVQQSQILARLPGRLAIAEPGRVRLRPAN